MAADITEEFQVDLTNVTSSSNFANNSLLYDIAINDNPFFSADSPENPYRRQTAQYRKEQSDISVEPGEQSLTGWWLRSQSSFHYGAGLNYYEPAQQQGYAQNQTIRYMFAESEGVNIWEEGNVTLLKEATAHAHYITSTAFAQMRSIKYGSTNGVLMLDGGDVDKLNVNGTDFDHFIDYNSGVDTYVNSITENGVYAYWVTNNDPTTGHVQVWKKPLTGVFGDSTESCIYRNNSLYAYSSVIEYVKGRLICTINNKVYELDQGIAGTNNALPTSIFDHGSSTYTFTDITESPASVYISGKEGMHSSIFKLSFDTDGTILQLNGAITVAEMPRGELIHSIQYYLGYLVIGTNRGVRVAEIGSDGSIVYGPLLFESSQPIYQITCSGNYVWVTTKINGYAGLIRIDLSTQLDTLVFPYANDLQATNIEAMVECTGVAFAGDSERLIFAAAGYYPYVESATTLRSSGWLRTGRIRFNTTENKFFKYVKERADYSNGGSIKLAVNDSNIITADSMNGNQDMAINLAACENAYFTFTLNRSTSDSTKGPILNSYQVKGLPATRKQRLIQYNLYCFDNEKDRNNVQVGYKGRAYERINLFENLEAAGDTVRVYDFRVNESFLALIEECSFTGTTAPDRGFSGFGGILTVTVRKL